MSAWIRMIRDEEADNGLLETLKLARTPHGTVDNVMRVHSLRPHTMKGHLKLYKSVLHDDSNTIPMWFQETLGSYVSFLNGCDYSFANHWKNAETLIDSKERSNLIKQALETRKPEMVFDGKELEILRYAEKLTLNPNSMVKEDIIKLRMAGWTDGEILEANQIVGYFCYANRLLNGLGVSTEGDVIGYYTTANQK